MCGTFFSDIYNYSKERVYGKIEFVFFLLLCARTHVMFGFGSKSVGSDDKPSVQERASKAYNLLANARCYNQLLAARECASANRVTTSNEMQEWCSFESNDLAMCTQSVVEDVQQDFNRVLERECPHILTAVKEICAKNPNGVPCKQMTDEYLGCGADKIIEFYANWNGEAI